MPVNIGLMIWAFLLYYNVHLSQTLPERPHIDKLSSHDSSTIASLPNTSIPSGHEGIENEKRYSDESLLKDLPETVTVTDRLKEELRKRQIIAPGYYEAECSDKKKCPSGKYCNILYCENCHKEKVICSEPVQCCDGLVCTYGRCDKGSKGKPGTFCEKDSDCGDSGCCVLEPTISRVHSVCRPLLDEFHQCAPILFRKIWFGVKPDCGPCKKGLECVQKGIYGSHQVCMKPE